MFSQSCLVKRFSRQSILPLTCLCIVVVVPQFPFLKRSTAIRSLSTTVNRSRLEGDLTNEIPGRSFRNVIASMEAVPNDTEFSQRDCPAEWGQDLNGRAIIKPQPDFVPQANAKEISGKVVVKVWLTVNKRGNVTSATPNETNDLGAPHPPTLMRAAKKAAFRAQFAPLKGKDCPAEYKGYLTYTLVAVQELPDFSISLVSPNGERDTVEPTQKDRLLRTVRIRKKGNESIDSLLKTNGLTVNANALMLVHILNPGINYHSLPRGSRITLPTTTGSSRLDQAKKKGLTIEILLYPKLRAELKRRSIVRSTCVPGDYEAIKEDAKRIEDAVHNALRDDIPVSIRTLDLISEVLDKEYRVLSSNCGADDDMDYHTFDELADALEPIAESVQNAENTDVRIVVSTVGENGKPYSGLAVFAKPPFVDAIERFPNLSSPTEHSLSTADYYIWAEGFSQTCEKIEVKVRPRKQILGVTLRCK